MDILDKISSKNPPKPPQKRTSLKSNAASSIPFDSPSDILSFPSNSSSIPNVSPPDSFKDCNSKNYDNNKSQSKQNHVNYARFASSLGVIMSEQSSEESKNTTKRRTQNRNQNRNSSTNKATANPIQLEQLSNRLKQTQVQMFQNEKQIKRLKQEKHEKCKRIDELENQLCYQRNRSSQQRRKLLQQQIELHQAQIKRMTASNQQDTKNKLEIIKWEHQTKENIYKKQIQGLKGLVQEYKRIIDQHSQFESNKKIMQLQLGSEIRQSKQQCMKSEKLKRQIQAKEGYLLRKQEELLRERRKFEQQKYQNKQQNQRERIRRRKQQFQNNTRIRHQQDREINEIETKKRMLQQKQRSHQLQCKQFQANKQIFEKEKQQFKQLWQRSLAQNKTNLQNVAIEKQRLSQLQQELIRKLIIVEKFSQINKQKCNMPANSLGSMMYQNKNPAKSQKDIKLDLGFYEQNIIPQKQNISPNLLHKKQQNRKQEQIKINVGDYLLKLQKSSTKSKIGGRPIYKLQEFYQSIN